MSGAEHERAAEAHTRSAEAHEAQLDPGAAERAGRSAICRAWTRSPAELHRAAAAADRRRAEEHHAASATLREAEERACSGVAAADRGNSPFEHAGEISSVRPLYWAGVIPGRGYRGPRPAGAVVTLRPVEGMTEESLQREIECHLARNASLGHVVPEQPNCPLVPRGVRARVSSSTEGFAVAIRSRDVRTAREILSRSRRLLPTHSGRDGSAP